MTVVLFSLFLNFKFFKKTALVNLNFMLFQNILKILKVSFLNFLKKKLIISCLVGSFILKIYNNTV